MNTFCKLLTLASLVSFSQVAPAFEKTSNSPFPIFSDYKVEVSTGPFKTGPTGSHLARKGPNLGGHYRNISKPMNGGYSNFLIMDLLTGNLFDLAPVEALLNYRDDGSIYVYGEKNSRLIMFMSPFNVTKNCMRVYATVKGDKISIIGKPRPIKCDSSRGITENDDGTVAFRDSLAQ